MNKSKEFTLIELLVVVAIIGILISILLPSVSRARDSAIAAVCSSNLKQMGVGFQMYEADNLRTPPAVTIPPEGTSNQSSWDKMIAVYFESSNASRSALAPFNCAANEYQTYLHSYGWGRRYTSYGGNGWTGVRQNVNPQPSPPSRALGVRSEKIESPSELYLVADAVYYRFDNHEGGNHPDCGSGEGAGYPCMNKYDAGDNNHGSLRFDHLNKLNMLHADKHVSLLSKVVYKTSSSVNWYASP